MACSIEAAIDNRYVLKTSVVNGILPNSARARPYLKDPYESYFCKDPDCFSEDCKECKPFDNYWDYYDIGFLTGHINKIVVIDIDPRNIPNFKNIKDFKDKIELAYGKLPKTWTVETGRGGLHFYYHYPYSFKTNKGKAITGIDFLGDNSWCRLPPYATKHGPYRWLIEPDEKNLAPLPKWVLTWQIDRYHSHVSKIYRPKINNYNKDDERQKVCRALSMIPINAAYNHEIFCLMGYSLCSSGYRDLFEEWCRTDSDQSKWVTNQQLNIFSKPGAVTIASFFNIAKSYGFSFND